MVVLFCKENDTKVVGSINIFVDSLGNVKFSSMMVVFHRATGNARICFLLIFFLIIISPEWLS